MRTASVLLLLVLAAACGHRAGSDGSASHGPANIPLETDMAGEVVVADPAAIRYRGHGGECVTRAPYDDIRAGVLVEIRSDTGVPKAITALQPGELRRTGTTRRPAGCAFGFSYARAAAGRPSFRVTVGDRKPVTVSYRDLLHIEVVLGRP